MTWDPWAVKDESARALWTFTALECVGPLRFGMGFDEVVTALNGATAGRMGFAGGRLVTEANFDNVGVTTFFGTSGGLTFVRVDALQGPQVTFEDVALIGRPPSEVGRRFGDLVEARGFQLWYTASGDPACKDLGIILETQRAGDVLLSRADFLAPDWARNSYEAQLRFLPEQEWGDF